MSSWRGFVSLPPLAGRGPRVAAGEGADDSHKEKKAPLAIADASHRRSSIKDGGLRPPVPSPRKRGAKERRLTRNTGPARRDRFWSAFPDRKPACARRLRAWSGRPGRI